MTQETYPVTMFYFHPKEILQCNLWVNLWRFLMRVDIQASYSGIYLQR